MAKKRKTPAQPAQDWNAPAAELLAEVPTDRDELLAAAVAAVVEIDVAIMRGDGAAAEAASDRYEAVIWKMNGGTHVGSMADHDAPGQVIERHCAAVPGDVPLWGQRGQFLVADGDMRALVEYESGYGGPLGAHFQFHVIDLDRPFISETGYRSHFDTARGCMTVDEVARGILAAQRAEKKRPVMVEASYRDRLADAPLPAWMAGLEPPARREPATVLVPPGFVLVDVVLPSHRAFIARRWAAEAATRIKAARAAGLNAKGKGTGTERDPASSEPTLPSSGAESCSIARNDDGGPADLVEFKPGQRCEIVSVHHPVFKPYIGKRIIIVKVHPDTRQVWAHDDRPITYKTNRAGRRVVDSDPSCIQSIYGFDQLRLIT
ncbi:klcB [Xanthomonas euvesicatoria]|uniref:klcB n=1 Tax=Xanthomonas euvesicatoria TaxID=456327 RepID=UPI001C48A45D|nr:klcB [Xanthomonas euvesicatoria]MBV6831308.1 klcB [Xanthomonas campestris pv. viegasii]